MKIILKIVLIAATIIGISLVAGCNTMKGFGKDLQQVGSEIEKAADK